MRETQTGCFCRICLQTLATAQAVNHLLLGGSWVVISGVISRVTVIITHIRGLITPLITIHEPLSLSPKPLNPIEPLKEPYNPKTLFNTTHEPPSNSKFQAGTNDASEEFRSSAEIDQSDIAFSL